MAGSKRKITVAERRHQDHLRRNGLKVSSVYEARLMRLRRAELRRVLGLCRDSGSAGDVPGIIAASIDESGYLQGWWQGLWTDAGMPVAKATASDLRQAKAAAEEDVWLRTLRRYATERAGSNIVIVSGTWKDSLVALAQRLLQDDLGTGVEKLTKLIYAGYRERLEKWQCRRIAQTETMIGLAEAADAAAKTLDIRYTKQWCISGLGNTRESHQVMDGVVVDEMEPFVLEGGLMMYPHDTGMGADASEIINCACACIRRPKRTHAPESSKEPDTVIPASTQPLPKIPAKPKPTPAPVVSSAFSAAEEERIAAMIQEMPDYVPAEARRAIAENNLALEKELKITKGAPMSVDDADKSHANPKYNESHSNKINCQTCSPAYVLRSRGFDVYAGPNTGREGNLSHYLADSTHFWEKWLTPDGKPAEHASVIEWRKSQNLSSMTAQDYFRFYDEATKEPGIYEVAVSWKRGGGHSTLLQRFADGSLMRIDAQVGTQKVMRDEWDAICYGAKAVTTDPCDGIMRVDDKVFAAKFAKIFRKVKK